MLESWVSAKRTSPFATSCRSQKMCAWRTTLQGEENFLLNYLGWHLHCQRMCLYPQEILRWKNWNLFCLAGLLHSDAGSGSLCRAGMFPVWIFHKGQLHLEVTYNYSGQCYKTVIAEHALYSPFPKSYLDVGTSVSVGRGRDWGRVPDRGFIPGH